MHMADALISPATGAAMWTAAGLALAHCVRKLRAEADERRVPLMGVLGAFVFAAQMINFSIPGTGASGHIGGAMLLAILLGPYAACLTIASILAVQALFFADGGLIALGCNIINIGVIPCLFAYPFIYGPIVRNRPAPNRLMAGAILSVVAGLQLGAFAVVAETTLSGISDLPFKGFVLLMQPIHLAIGVMEGLITAAVVRLVWKARPEILQMAAGIEPCKNWTARRVTAGLGLAALIAAGGLSALASRNPDGLEWAIAHSAPTGAIHQTGGIHAAADGIQGATAVLPDYNLPGVDGKQAETAQTSAAGMAGAALIFVVAGGLAAILRMHASRRKIVLGAGDHASD